MSNRSWNGAVIILFILLVIVLSLFVLSALRIERWVGPISQNAGQSAASKHIVLISQELDNPFWRAVEQGARDASAEHSYTLEYIGPNRINPAEQLKLLEKSIAAKVDAILLQGINDPAYRDQIDRAANLGIPVITVDTDEPGSRRLSYVGSNQTEAGRLMGELLLESSGRKGAVGVLIGNELADNQRQRLAGFRSVVDRYPELRVVEVRSSNISRLQAARQAEDMLEKHPDMAYLVGFSALDGIGALDAVKRIDSEGITILAFDDLAETIEGIKACSIASTLVQQPRQMGHMAVSVLNEYFLGKATRPEQHTRIEILDRKKLGSTAGGMCR